MAGKPEAKETNLPRRNSFCVRKVSDSERKEMGKPTKFEDSGSGKKAKIKLMEKSEATDVAQTSAKPDEINIMSLFQLIQETAKEQRENQKRIEENICRNTSLLKETSESLSKDMEKVKTSVLSNEADIKSLKNEVQEIKEYVDPDKYNKIEEEARSAMTLAEHNKTEADKNKARLEELENKVTKLGKDNDDLRRHIDVLKDGVTRSTTNPEEVITSNEQQHQPKPSSSAGNSNIEKKTYAEILLEEKKRRFNVASEAAKPTPIFITSDKSASEIFNEAKHYAGIENVTSIDIRKYLWHGEAGEEGVDPSDMVSDLSLMYADKFKEQRINAATGILTDRFGFYLNEVQIEDAWFCTLRGPGSMYISSSNKYFIRSIYWKAAAARDRNYRVGPWIPLAASDRKVELERRLAKIRKTQPNLRTQVRLGEDDFDVLGKYANTGKVEKFELIPRERYDPNYDLPKIRCKETTDGNSKESLIREANSRLEDAANKDDIEGWSPVTNKRKERSPAQETNGKKTRKFSPSKAGKAIHNQIKNRGIISDDILDSSDSDSEHSDLEESGIKEKCRDAEEIAASTA